VRTDTLEIRKLCPFEVMPLDCSMLLHLAQIVIKGVQKSTFDLAVFSVVPYILKSSIEDDFYFQD
jgi:hypothetical protein